MAAKRKIVQGLRRRWITGSIGPVVVILLLVGVLISVGFASNYYNSAKSTLRAKAAAGADYFNTYVMTSYREYYRSATLYAAAFEDSDRIELQFLNSAGRVGHHPRPDGGHISQHAGGSPGRGDRSGAGFHRP